MPASNPTDNLTISTFNPTRDGERIIHLYEQIENALGDCEEIALRYAYYRASESEVRYWFRHQHLTTFLFDGQVLGKFRGHTTLFCNIRFSSFLHAEETPADMWCAALNAKRS